MGNFLLPDITGMRVEGEVKGFAVDILRVIREVFANRRGKVDIGAVGHSYRLGMPTQWPLT